jgi:hypothetical protein
MPIDARGRARGSNDGNPDRSFLLPTGRVRRREKPTGTTDVDSVGYGFEPEEAVRVRFDE